MRGANAWKAWKAWKAQKVRQAPTRERVRVAHAVREEREETDTPLRFVP